MDIFLRKSGYWSTCRRVPWITTLMSRKRESLLTCGIRELGVLFHLVIMACFQRKSDNA